MGIFEIISLILKLLGLYDGLMNHMDSVRRAEVEKNRQEREKAVDDVAKGETDEEIFDGETRVVDHLP